MKYSSTDLVVRTAATLSHRQQRHTSIHHSQHGNNTRSTITASINMTCMCMLELFNRMYLLLSLGNNFPLLSRTVNTPVMNKISLQALCGDSLIMCYIFFSQQRASVYRRIDRTFCQGSFERFENIMSIVPTIHVSIDEHIWTREARALETCCKISVFLFPLGFHLRIGSPV